MGGPGGPPMGGPGGPPMGGPGGPPMGGPGQDLLRFPFMKIWIRMVMEP